MVRKKHKTAKVMLDQIKLHNGKEIKWMVGVARVVKK